MINWREIGPRRTRSELEKMGLVSLPAAEIREIKEYVERLVNGDARHAQWLMRAALYDFYGQSWGESLWYAEEESDLVDLEALYQSLSRLADGGTELIQKNLFGAATRALYYDFGDAGLYLMMLEDLLGHDALVKFFDKLSETVGGEKLEISEEEMDHYRKEYEGTVGLTMMEWSDEILLMRFVELAAAWGMILERGKKLGETFEIARLNTAFGLEVLIKEVLYRGLVSRGGSLVLEGVRLTYKELMELKSDVSRYS